MRDESPIGVDERDLDDAALEALAEAYATPAPRALRARVLREARRDAAMRAAARRVGRWRLVGVLAAGAVLVVGALLVRVARIGAVRGTELEALARDNAALTARVDEQDHALAGVRQSLAAQAQALKVLSAPRTVTAALAPQRGGTASGRVLLDATSGDGALVLSGVSPPAPGSIYELWVIRGERAPEPAGLFSIGADAALIAPVDRIARPEDVTAFALSIEPAAGSSAPTGPIVLAGPVAG